MSEELKGHLRGTHRAIAPEQTLQILRPHLASFGITRCADVTMLDGIGIPVCCAIRPITRTLQVSNGKGLRKVDAAVSALMEATELFHAENPAPPARTGSIESLRERGERWMDPRRLHGFDATCHFDDRCQVEWLPAEELKTDGAAWVLASGAAFDPGRALCHWTSNGLASGNTLREATLHALYEVLERHEISLMAQGGEIDFQGAQVVDNGSIDDGDVASLVERAEGGGLGVVLIRPRSELQLNTFMAVFLDSNPFGNVSRMSVGFGSHLSASVAAIRALTEAAQTRLTYIHGSREDLRPQLYRGGDAQERVFEYFSSLEANTPWREISDFATASLSADYAQVLAILGAARFGGVYRVDLTRLEGIHIVKVLVEGAGMERELF